MKSSVTLAEFGRWNHLDTGSGLVGIVHYYDLAYLSSTKSHSIVLSGWAFAGWNNNTHYKINIAIIDQNEKGILKLNTASYVENATTNGSGSVIAHDFNSDGIDDIFLAAHNESPLISTSSTVYLSQPGKKFSKITLDDSTQSHSAILSNFQGVPTVITAGYGGLDPYYRYSPLNNNFEVALWENTYSGSIYGSAALVGDLDNDGISELVIGDFKTGPGIPYSTSRPANIAIYKVADGRLADSPALQLDPYFNQERYQNIGLATDFGASLSHIYRAWTDDFNHDGKEDLLFGVGVWSSTGGWSRAKLQMFQNNGNLNFSDVTDNLGDAYDEKSSFVDYSMQMLDIDRSGIKSYLLAGDPGAKGKHQSNYLLLNDGTGKLHEALHDEFSAWSKGGGGKFIPYLRNDGLLSYLYIDQQNRLYNFDLQYDASKDFNDIITVNDRNHSNIIRTFAGNDVITDLNRSSNITHIDGGLGYDTAIYSMEQSKYSISVNNDHTFSIKDVFGYTDVLKNVERFKFTDSELHFPILGSIGGDNLKGTENDDVLNGLEGNDLLFGGKGADTLIGGLGDDLLDGEGGLDAVDYSSAGTSIKINLAKGSAFPLIDADSFGSGTDKLKGIEVIIASSFSDLIVGDKSSNQINASDGDDSIDGGLGSDTLIGGSGNDYFFFSSKRSLANADVIQDFIKGEDKIQLHSKVFSRLKGVSDLDNYFYVVSELIAQPISKTHHLIYEKSYGRLYYDPDGSGKGLASLITTLGSSIDLASSDIVVV